MALRIGGRRRQAAGVGDLRCRWPAASSSSGSTELVLDRNGLLGVRTFLVTHPTGVLLVAPVVLVMDGPAPDGGGSSSLVQGVALMAALARCSVRTRACRCPSCRRPVLLWAALRFGPGVTDGPDAGRRRLRHAGHGAGLGTVRRGGGRVRRHPDDPAGAVVGGRHDGRHARAEPDRRALPRAGRDGAAAARSCCGARSTRPMLGMLWLRAPDGEPIEQACVVRTNDLAAQMLGVGAARSRAGAVARPAAPRGPVARARRSGADDGRRRGRLAVRAAGHRRR